MEIMEAGQLKIKKTHMNSSFGCICSRNLHLLLGCVVKFRWKYQQKAPKLKETVLYMRKHGTRREEMGVDQGKKTGNKRGEGTLKCY